MYHTFLSDCYACFALGPQTQSSYHMVAFCLEARQSKLLEIKYFISFQEFTTLLRSERLEIEEHMPTYQ